MTDCELCVSGGSESYKPLGEEFETGVVKLKGIKSRKT